MQVCLDTASFEVVRNCWQGLLSLLEEGLVDLLLCNEDEALAVAEASTWLCALMQAQPPFSCKANIPAATLVIIKHMPPTMDIRLDVMVAATPCQ